jgi:Skp family chaperone for outer membrane proteins
MIFPLLLALAVQSAPAVTSLPPIGILNVPRLVAESIDGKAATAQLKALQLEREKGIADKRSALARLNQSKALPAQIERAQLDLQRVTQDAELDLAALQRDLQVEFDKKLRPVLNQVAGEEHIGIIFQYPAPVISWIVPSMDVTSKVIERLDAAAKEKP